MRPPLESSRYVTSTRVNKISSLRGNRPRQYRKYKLFFNFFFYVIRICGRRVVAGPLHQYRLRVLDVFEASPYTNSAAVRLPVRITRKGFDDGQIPLVRSIALITRTHTSGSAATALGDSVTPGDVTTARSSVDRPRRGLIFRVLMFARCRRRRVHGTYVYNVG